MNKLRTPLNKAVDFITFPIRAFALFEKDIFGMSSQRTERFDYVARELRGHTLDFGCGRENYFIKHYTEDGVGVDVFKYQGLTDDQILKDPSKLPFEDGTFDSITFIANINHVPEHLRDIELAESYRCLKSGGNIIITMGSPIAEIMVHKVVYYYDKFLGTNVDMDTERGMEEDENYYLTSKEITDRMKKAGFKNIKHKLFLTQWGLNGLFTGDKE